MTLGGPVWLICLLGLSLGTAQESNHAVFANLSASSNSSTPLIPLSDGLLNVQNPATPDVVIMTRSTLLGTVSQWIQALMTVLCGGNNFPSRNFFRCLNANTKIPQLWAKMGLNETSIQVQTVQTTQILGENATVDAKSLLTLLNNHITQLPELLSRINTEVSGFCLNTDPLLGCIDEYLAHCVTPRNASAGFTSALTSNTLNNDATIDGRLAAVDGSNPLHANAPMDNSASGNVSAASSNVSVPVADNNASGNLTMDSGAPSNVSAGETSTDLSNSSQALAADNSANMTVDSGASGNVSVASTLEVLKNLSKVLADLGGFNATGNATGDSGVVASRTTREVATQNVAAGNGTAQNLTGQARDLDMDTLRLIATEGQQPVSQDWFNSHFPLAESARDVRDFFRGAFAYLCADNSSKLQTAVSAVPCIFNGLSIPNCDKQSASFSMADTSQQDVCVAATDMGMCYMSSINGACNSTDLVDIFTDLGLQYFNHTSCAKNGTDLSSIRLSRKI